MNYLKLNQILKFLLVNDGIFSKIWVFYFSYSCKNQSLHILLLFWNNEIFVVYNEAFYLILLLLSRYILKLAMIK